MCEMKKQQGFTLFETLISMAILCVVTVALITGLATSSRSMILANERETALDLAKSQMEYIMNLPYDDVSPYDYSGWEVPAEHSLWHSDISVQLIDPDGTGPKISMQKISVTMTDPQDNQIKMTTGGTTLEDYKVHP
jgi:prepilin-type N-terminal cleavage/methylation domain-containing protein